MRKSFRSFTCMLLVVALFCAFAINSAALSDEMTHVYDGGTIRFLNRTCNYTTDTAASYTSASATLTCDIVASLSANIEASMLVQNEFCYNENSAIAQSTTVSASVTNVYYYDGVPVVGVITGAIGTYQIGANNSFVSSVN